MLQARCYTNEATVVEILRSFARRAAEPAIVTLLHRAHEAPGPTLATKTQQLGVDVRLRISREVSGQPQQEALRILGMSVVQAAVGVIGGAGTLATDNQVRGDQGVIPLEQALRETTVGGQVLSLSIHDSAQAMADALASWTYVESRARTAWTRFHALISDDVATQIRTKSGLPRIWPIELLANAFVHVAGGALQAKASEALGGDNPLITEMGLRASDVAARRTMAEQRRTQTAENEVAAHAAVDLAEQQDRFRAPSRELFDALANINRVGEQRDFVEVGAKLTALRSVANITAPAPGGVSLAAAAAPMAQHDASARPGGPAQPGQGAPTNYREFYIQTYGIDPVRHAVQVAIALNTPHHSSAQVGGWFGVSSAELTEAPPTPTDALVIDARNASLVGPDFTVAEAVRRANEIWDLLHGEGQIQLLRALIDGRTEEEQRLIHIAFRRKSGGIELNFYMQQHLAHTTSGRIGGSGGGGGADGTGGAIMMYGSAAEAELMVEISTTGRVSLERRITAAVAGTNMNDVYDAIASATAEERRALLANHGVMNRLRAFGDDSSEWQRIHGILTGQRDLFDRLESRTHGTHGFLGGVDNTDEVGMRQDLTRDIRSRKAAITREVVSSDAEPTPAQSTEIDNRLRQQCLELSENPSVRAILAEEMSGTEMSERHGLVMNAGEDVRRASVLTDGDMTEDEEKILSDIRAMSPAERARLRNDPAYLGRLQAAIQSEGTWRDAMIALDSDAAGGTEEGSYALVDRFARSTRQDATEINVEADELIQALSRLTPRSSSGYGRIPGSRTRS